MARRKAEYLKAAESPAFLTEDGAALPSQEAGEPAQSSDEISRQLEEHRLWVESNGAQGCRLRLLFLEASRTDLASAPLMGADLSGARLRGANLRACDLRWAELTHADLRHADLTNADLSGARGLLPDQLAGANLRGARLPADVAAFDRLDLAAEGSTHAQNMLLAILLGCVYVWLTIGTTRDALLLTNSASTPLPIIQTAIPIVGFYLVSPLILVLAFLYFHSCLLRLRKQMSLLPAVFPSGNELGSRFPPWLSPDSAAQRSMSALLAWWLVPLTLVFLWFRYLTRHDWRGTVLHVALILAAVLAVMLLTRSTARLQGTRPASLVQQSLALAALSLLLLAVSHAIIHGSRASAQSPAHSGTWLVGTMAWLGFDPFADFTDEEVSVKTPQWSEEGDGYRRVRPATLKDRDLRFVKASGSFLVRADLRGADLSHGNLRRADLRWAELQAATLVAADLEEANLQHARLTCEGDFRSQRCALLMDASLRGANLASAEMAGAQMRGAKLDRAGSVGERRPTDASDAGLTGADLTDAQAGDAVFSGARMRGVKMIRAKLSGAKFAEADLTCTSGSIAVGEGQLCADFTDATLDAADFTRADLRGANFRGARLDGTTFRGADLTGAIVTPEALAKSCGDAATRPPRVDLVVPRCPEEPR